MLQPIRASEVDTPFALFRLRYVNRIGFKRIGKGKKKKNEEWVEILVTYDYIEAEIIKELLESGGIPVVLRSSKVTPFPVNVGKIGEIKVLVKNGDKQMAEKVIEGDNKNNSPES